MGSAQIQMLVATFVVSKSIQSVRMVRLVAHWRVKGWSRSRDVNADGAGAGKARARLEGIGAASKVEAGAGRHRQRAAGGAAPLDRNVPLKTCTVPLLLKAPFQSVVPDPPVLVTVPLLLKVAALVQSEKVESLCTTKVPALFTTAPP